MKRLTIVLSLLCLMAGCQHTPLQQVEDARSIYVASLHEINLAHNAGYISVAQKQKLAPTTQAIATGLDIAEAAAVADKPDATSLIPAVNALLDAALTEAGIDPVTLQKVK